MDRKSADRIKMIMDNALGLMTDPKEKTAQELIADADFMDNLSVFIANQAKSLRDLESIITSTEDVKVRPSYIRE